MPQRTEHWRSGRSEVRPQVSAATIWTHIMGIVLLVDDEHGFADLIEAILTDEGT